MITDEERYPLAYEAAEAGALIQRHLGNGAVYRVIEDAESFLDRNTDEDAAEELDQDSETLIQGAYLVGFARGLSEIVWQNVTERASDVCRAEDTRELRGLRLLPPQIDREAG